MKSSPNTHIAGGIFVPVGIFAGVGLGLMFGNVTIGTLLGGLAGIAGAALFSLLSRRNDNR